MQGALVQFLDNGDGVRFPLILNWLPKMKQIEKWFEVPLKCFAASVRMFPHVSFYRVVIYSSKRCSHSTPLLSSLFMRAVRPETVQINKC